MSSGPVPPASEAGIGAGARSPQAEARLSRPNESVPVPTPDLADHQAVARWRSTINEMWGQQNDPDAPHHPARLGGVECLVAGDAADPTVVYAHGGGYCLGSAAVAIPITARLVRPGAELGLGGLRVVSVDYRLAPEHPFPAAVDDVRAVCEAVAADGPYAVAGDSAGGGLVLAATQDLVPDGLGPVAVALLSPHLAFGSGTAGDTDTTALLDAYVAGADRLDPRLSPLLGETRALPPTLLQVAEGERGWRDAAALSRRVRAAGGTCDLDVWLGLWHTWHYHEMPEADLALAEVRRFLLAHLRGRFD